MSSSHGFSSVSPPAPDSSLPRIFIIPGMGCTPVSTSNWYAHVCRSLTDLGYDVILRDFPEPIRCYEHEWMKFIKQTLKPTENDILIGHSTGSIAIQRYLEHDRALGAILVSTYHTDMGSKEEADSGYFGRPWDWAAIKGNAKWIAQWHSINDKCVPVQEARQVAQWLDTDYHEEEKMGHFLRQTFQDLVDFVEFKCKGRIKITNKIATGAPKATTAAAVPAPAAAAAGTAATAKEECNKQ